MTYIMKNTAVGFPRVGKLRELKFWTEKYFKNELSKEELLKNAEELRKEQWNLQKEAGLDLITSNDFSFYDNMLDTAVLLNAVPAYYKNLGLDELDRYFAMARGYQGEKGDVKSLAMKKWFNTNYHYIVPEIDDETEIKLAGEKPFKEYKEAAEIGIKTKSAIVGPFTFIKLAKFKGTKKAENYIDDIENAYKDILIKFNETDAEYVQFDEPYLVTDLNKEDIKLFTSLYDEILKEKGNLKIILQTYFGDIRDCYKEAVNLNVDAIGLDFLEGRKTLELLKENGFPEDKTLLAGIINGKNIWKADYREKLNLLKEIKQHAENVVLNTSCSLLHVPYTLKNETKLNENVKKYFAFAEEKLTELKELSILADTDDYTDKEIYKKNQELFNERKLIKDDKVQADVAALKEKDFKRSEDRKDRQQLQRKELNLPLLPTTTIGSFPQTAEVKHNRAAFRKNEITEEEYKNNNKKFIEDCIRFQEIIGLDVLVHGEYERNDMVEFFGENLSGYVFTQKAWVQSYGTRCVKPPIIFGDIKREKPITVEYSAFAQSLTDKPVKGMLTGPVTILNWSFPREDIPHSEMAFQIGLAIRDEVSDLEKAGIKIIQIDEAALKEKLPIRKEEWYSEYLNWAVKAFRLCSSRVKPETQIHTHMCYSEFEEIVKDIDNMDADVISFEASKSKLAIIDALNKAGFETEAGPGVYDIHSPRVPSVQEITDVLNNILKKIPKEKLWINPDCGLKTRGIEETEQSLKNLVQAAAIVRNSL